MKLKYNSLPASLLEMALPYKIRLGTKTCSNGEWVYVIRDSKGKIISFTQKPTVVLAKRMLKNAQKSIAKGSTYYCS